MLATLMIAFWNWASDNATFLAAVATMGFIGASLIMNSNIVKQNDKIHKQQLNSNLFSLRANFYLEFAKDYIAMRQVILAFEKFKATKLPPDQNAEANIVHITDMNYREFREIEKQSKPRYSLNQKDYEAIVKKIYTYGKQSVVLHAQPDLVCKRVGYRMHMLQLNPTENNLLLVYLALEHSAQSLLPGYPEKMTREDIEEEKHYDQQFNNFARQYAQFRENNPDDPRYFRF